MPKAHITTSSGLNVQIEGTVDEVAALIAHFPITASTPPISSPKARRRKAIGAPSSRAAKNGPTNLISNLASEGFFQTRQSIDTIQKKLEELGHIYAKTSISPILTRLTRRKTLRRVKEAEGWAYVV